MISDSWVQGSQTNEGIWQIAEQKQENFVCRDVCERAKLSPVPCGVRVAREADLDLNLALALAGYRVLGKCLIYFRGAFVFSFGQWEYYY